MTTTYSLTVEMVGPKPNATNWQFIHPVIIFLLTLFNQGYRILKTCAIC